MAVLSVLLVWLPIIGPLVAGIVGGKKAGGVGPALVAVFLPALISAIVLFGLLSYFSGVPLLGAIAGIGVFTLAISDIGPLLLGAVIGGALA